MSTERELVEKFNEAFQTKKMGLIYPYLADDMTYEVLPSTVGMKSNKDEWIGHLNGMLPIIQSAKLEITNIVESPMFTVVQENVDLVFRHGPFTQEIILLFNFRKENDRLKITSITEYVDSLKVKELRAKIASELQSS